MVGIVPHASDGDAERLRELTDRLLVRDADAHADAIAELAEAGDERVLPHIVELIVIDSIANDWPSFGFPAVLRDHDPPRYLELPDVRWPGVGDALAALADPDFDSDHAWVEWETWYSQRDVEPLAGFDEWKLRLYRSYLPPVGGLLACEPRAFDLQAIRWGNCDRSFLAALNAPEFVPGAAVDAGGDATGSDAADAPERYLDDDHVVFGFEIAGTPYAVPRWVLFPHELRNAELGGVAVALTYCTLCNAPILYDHRVGGSGDADVRTFGSTGLLAAGNKVIYDEETETLWDQHAGTPIGGDTLATDPDLVLDQFAVTQTEWGAWKAASHDTRALDIDTGYGYDYGYYDGGVGFFEQYWTREEIVRPGVRRADDRLPETASVYGIADDDADAVWVVSVDDLRDRELGVLTAEVDADGARWRVSRTERRSESGDTRDRIPGRHGLWFAFRTHYDTARVVS